MMVERGMGGDKLAVQSNYHPYPPPLATYEDVATSRDLFMDTLKKFHVSMGTKFMIPVVGGRDLDLHRLFVEVTSRGGITKVLKDKKWKEVTSVFSFPSSATNASFILRKYYVSLLYHYEQTYLFKAKCWTPSPSDTIQHLSSTITATHTHGLSQNVPSVTQQTHATAPPNTATSMPQESFAAGSAVCGVIDGKFDSGYLITVKIGSEEFKGVLYQVPASINDHQTQTFPNHHISSSSVKPPRRKRRKKSEIRKRDPAHPKPNRSGYNFFFAEQHATLKPLYHGKDREISRIIGETWNKLNEPQRAVYQEKALKDKERYKIEMEEYRERLRTGQIAPSSSGVLPPRPVINLTDLNGSSILQFESTTTSAYTLQDHHESADKTPDKSSSLEEYESADKELDFGECSQADHTELKNVNIEIMADDEAFDLQTNKVDEADDVMHENDMLTLAGGNNNDVVLGEDGISVPIEETSNANANESVLTL